MEKNVTKLSIGAKKLPSSSEQLLVTGDISGDLVPEPQNDKSYKFPANAFKLAFKIWKKLSLFDLSPKNAWIMKS